LEQLMRLAASRTFCAAGKSRPMSTAMMAMTTRSSMSVKPHSRRRRIDEENIMDHLRFPHGMGFGIDGAGGLNGGRGGRFAPTLRAVFGMRLKYRCRLSLLARKAKAKEYRARLRGGIQ